MVKIACSRSTWNPDVRNQILKRGMCVERPNLALLDVHIIIHPGDEMRAHAPITRCSTIAIVARNGLVENKASGVLCPVKASLRIAVPASGGFDVDV